MFCTSAKRSLNSLTDSCTTMPFLHVQNKTHGYVYSYTYQLRYQCIAYFLNG